VKPETDAAGRTLFGVASNASAMEPRPSTFSIVARDPETDAVGVAV